MNHQISLLDKSSNRIVVDYTKIDSISYNTQSDLIISVNGHAISLGEKAYLISLNHRLECLKSLDNIGFDNLNQEMRKLHNMLSKPETFAKSDLQDYHNIFFSTVEIANYPLRNNDLNDANKKKLDLIYDSINAFKELNHLNQTLNEELKPSNTQKLKI